jgi:Polysaccharide lyase
VPPQTQAPKPATPSLFDGVEIDDFPEIQAAPGAITEVADPLGSGETVLKMTVDDDDVAPITPTENPRAQALSPSLIDPGEEFWLATKFMLPHDFPATVPGWLALVEVYGRPFDGPSPWGIGISDDEFTWQRNGTYDYDIPWRMPLARERWVHVLLHERFAGDGWVEMWIDGRKVTFFPGGGKSTERLAMATMDASNHASPNVAKIMNYRQLGMFETVSVYFGALRIGETQASVTG